MIGRRPGRSTTRQDLIDAARVVFAERGIAGATTRLIAAEAGVDASMIQHHFGSKDGLFQAVLAIPVDPAKVLAPMFSASPYDAGRTLLGLMLATWDSEVGSSILALVRSATQDPTIAEQAREYLLHRAILPIVRRFAPDPRPDHVAERASLLATQVAGLLLARYVLRIEPLASADHEWILERIAPTVQRYLTGPLPD
jgi:AcrR family transcriptional regulator